MKKITGILVSVILTAIIISVPAVVVQAESADALYQKGVAAENKNDTDTALKYYIKAAIAGNLDGLNKADQYYQSDIGDVETYKELYDYLNKNVPAGDAYANYVRGLLYQYDGLGTGTNITEAIKSYKVAADKGYMPAFDQLTDIYCEQGLNTDAFETIKKAADLGDSKYLKWAGYAYYQGFGVTEDVQKAIDYLNASAKQGDTEAMLFLGDCCAYGKKVKKNQDLAISYYEKATKAGDPEGYYKIGEYYESGAGIPKDENKAYEYYLKGAENGHLESMHMVATMILKTGTDNDLAIRLLTDNADRGCESSMKQLAILYRDGKTVKQDNEKYIHYLTCLADSGNLWGLNELGVEYYMGGILRKDPQKAFDCFSKAAACPERTGNEVANLAACYENGVGVKKNLATAKEYYQLAVDLGDKEAVKRLNRCNDLLAKEAADKKAKEITVDDVYNAVMGISTLADAISDKSDAISDIAGFLGFEGISEKAGKVSEFTGKVAIPKKAKDLVDSFK